MIKEFPKTPQEMYDVVKQHLLGMDDYSFDLDDQSCMYRYDETAACSRRCFIGACIPDKRYHPEMESRTADEILLNYNLTSDSRIIQFALELQEIHDNAAITQVPFNREYLLEGIKRVAIGYGITPN